MNIQQRLRAFREKLNKSIPTPAQVIERRIKTYPPNFRASPIPLMLGAAGAGAIAARGYSAVKTGAARILANPFAGQTARQAFGSVAVKAAGTLGIAYGVPAIYSATSGEPYKAPSLRRAGLAAAGSGVVTFPLAAAASLAGFTKQYGKKAADVVKETYQEFQEAPPVNITDILPYYQTPQEPQINFDFGSSGVSSPLPSGVSAAYAPSINVGGVLPSSDMTALILALLGGGALGYIAGRRRKKKKSKKSKKRRKQ